MASRVDLLYFYLLSVTAFFVILICALVLYFGIKYRRGSPAPRAVHPTNYTLEVVWCVIPLVLVMVMFGWGARLYFELYDPPPDAMVVHVVGKQWMWKTQHPTGRREIDRLHVPVDTPVELRMISEDVIHSFYIPAFRVKTDVLPGRYHRLWFNATKPGRYHLFCAEYCGTGHAQMRGEVIVLSK
ncbi:MAG TPA: cytochrome c oxidase subunit II, partial [Planctomycetaceae bacterium]|nr:cytochrome c oxidase subunit II [Planctomycetaceae bacterium]